MPDTNISSTAYGDLTNTEAYTFDVSAMSTDGPADQKETEYTNSNAGVQLGYYKQIPELKIAIDAKATWTIGKGFKADADTTLLLDRIKGFGKDTFNSILANMIRSYHVYGDSFAEVIRDNEGRLVNLKPLDPASIKIVANRKGIIKKYVQFSKVKGNDKKFNPEDIFHLSRNRVADEIHGVSLIDAVESIILARNEAMADMKRLMHRHVQPIIKWELDTDDTAKIAAFKAKADIASDKGENIFIPKGAVSAEILAVAHNATLNPLPWIQQLNQYFFQATGVPQIIVGGSQEMTEATAKIAYLAFEQTIEEEQLYIEEQNGQQLGVMIELEFPASLENEMITDMGKEEKMQASTPEDTALTGGMI